MTVISEGRNYFSKKSANSAEQHGMARVKVRIVGARGLQDYHGLN